MTGAARRDAELARLADESFDLLVVGGGATGAGIARDAALRGLRVALCERADFASETSSHSSKLIHGGLRYLQYGDLRLVFEALRERRILMRTAPHLCRPVEFLFPSYRGSPPSLLSLGAGIALYNALALWRAPVAGRRLSVDETLTTAPGLRSEALTGSHLYVDCQTNDARLVLETIMDAESAGAAIGSQVEVTGLARDRRGRVHAAHVRDRQGGATFSLRARMVVNATGPFSDAFDRGRQNLRPTLGVHLVFDADRIPHGDRATVLLSPRDGRLVFMLPAGRRTILGTTDTDWRAPDQPGRPPRPGDWIGARRVDVDYLLDVANHAFPAARLGPEDVVSTFAGLRPLVATSAHSTSATSREHEMVIEPDGVLTVVGGKLTTYRRMAEEAVDKAIEYLRDHGLEAALGPCVTDTRPLPGGAAPASMGELELAPDVTRHLGQTYGGRAREVVSTIITAGRSDSEGLPNLSGRIDPTLPYLWGEIVFAARHERVCEIEDVMCRRLPLFRDSWDQGAGVAAKVAALVADVLGWDQARTAASLQRYRGLVAASRAWREAPLT
jgi:glycerol-3-phosphate dehydrogenase